MENVTNVEVLQINTQPSQTSVRDLRTQIKDLKNELLNLDAGTEEYNDTLLKLGDAQHQLVELNEQMRQTTSDFGDRLGNTTRLLAGMSGAVSAVTGTLSLLGIEVGDDTKLMKLLVSAMSITQGLAAIDAGIKSFKALKVSIQAATAAQNGFNKAVLKNPYIIAGAAILATIAAIGAALKAKARAEDEAHARNIANLRKELELQEQIYQSQVKMEVDLAKYRVQVSDMTKSEIDAQKKSVSELVLELTAGQQVIKKELIDTEETIKTIKAQWNEAVNTENYKRAQELHAQSIALHERRNKLMEQEASYTEELNTAYGKMEILSTAVGKAEKTTNTTVKEQYTLYEKVKNAISLASAQGEEEIITKMELLRVETDHLATLKEGTQEYDKQAIVVAELNSEIEKMKKEERLGAAERKKAIADSLVELRKLQDEYQGLQLDNGLAQTEPVTFGDIDEQRDAEIAKEQYKTQVHLEQLDMQHQADVDYWNARLALEQQDSQAYQDAMMQKNLMEQTYQNESLRASQELEDKKTEIQANAEQQRKTLTQKYVQVIGGLANELGGLFDAIADGSEDNYKLQRGLMVASAIITTLASSVAALYTVWSDSTLGLWAKIAMSVATVASVIATGFTLVNQMKSVKPSSGNASAPNVTAVQSLSAPISNVRQTQSHDEEGTIGGEQQSQRVVLVMSDLEAMNDTKVDVEQSTTF